MKGVSACTPTSLNFLLCTDLESFAEMYAVDTGTLEVEASLVKTVLESQSSESTVNTLATFRSYLYSCQQAYNTLYLLSKIMLTIAVTSTESERFFSVLKRIKACLKNRMAEDRLSDLAIEKEVAQQLDYDKIIDEFASLDKNRCIVLL